MEVNPARAATGASMSAATAAAFVNMLRVFTIHDTSIGDIISNFSAADEMDGRVLAHADCMVRSNRKPRHASRCCEGLLLVRQSPRTGQCGRRLLSVVVGRRDNPGLEVGALLGFFQIRRFHPESFHHFIRNDFSFIAGQMMFRNSP